jgi:hypothetical protein
MSGRRRTTAWTVFGGDRSAAQEAQKKGQVSDRRGWWLDGRMLTPETLWPVCLMMAKWPEIRSVNKVALKMGVGTYTQSTTTSHEDGLAGPKHLRRC